jgi:hypothetical protein
MHFMGRLTRALFVTGMLVLSVFTAVPASAAACARAGYLLRAEPRQ